VDAVALPTVEVTSPRETRRERTRFETEAGVTARVIGGEELKILPGLGEADVMRAVEVLPGVISTSDFSSAFNVRGGSADQNLILLDGFPIFNPFHLGGLFSVFNSDVIARAELFSGGFGAQYGGRVSSVLSVESRTEAPERLAGDVGVSILATRLALARKLPEGLARGVGGTGGSWYLSGRRSYLDALVAPVASFPYHLTDLQAGTTLELRGGGRVQLTGYTGRDVLDLSDFTPPGSDTDVSILRFRWNWGNDLAGVRWIQPVGRAWVAETRLGWSRYSEALGFSDFGDTRFSSSIRQTTLATDLRREVGPALTLAAGGELSRVGYLNLGDAGGTVFFESENDGLMGAATDRRAGRRGALAAGGGAPRRGVARHRPVVPAPVAAAGCEAVPGRFPERGGEAGGRAVRAVPALAARRAAPHLQRHLGDGGRHRAARGLGPGAGGGGEVLGRPVERLGGDVRPPLPGRDGVQPGRRPQRSRRRPAGGDGALVRGGPDGAAAGGAAHRVDDAVAAARRRTFPDPLALGLDDVPQAVTFAPVWDRTADVDVVLSYDLPGGIDAGARWNFGTGIPYSRPVGQFVAFETSTIDGGYRVQRPIGDDDGSVPIYIVPGERNRQRYPAYHRLDVTLRRPYARRWGSFTPYLQVLNAYDRRNVLFYFYNYDRDPPVRSGISMFPLIPTIGVEAGT
jgi:hypothetical protein